MFKSVLYRSDTDAAATLHVRQVEPSERSVILTATYNAGAGDGIYVVLNETQMRHLIDVFEDTLKRATPVLGLGRGSIEKLR